MAQLIYIPQIFPFESRKEQIFIRYRLTLGDLNIIVRDILLANFNQMVRMIAQSTKVFESTLYYNTWRFHCPYLQRICAEHSRCWCVVDRATDTEIWFCKQDATMDFLKIVIWIEYKIYVVTKFKICSDPLSIPGFVSIYITNNNFGFYRWDVGNFR